MRKGDVVKVMRGKFKKKQGKVLEVGLKKSRVVVENIQVKKKDGSKVNIKMQPSNLQIIELNLEDKKRTKKLGIERTKEKEAQKDIKTDSEKIKENTPKKGINKK